MDCPKCGSIATDINPLKGHTEDQSVFVCEACKHVFKSDGLAYCSNNEELRDVFKGATAANSALLRALDGEQLPPLVFAMLKLRMVEYGLQMWFDGLKQGLLLGVHNDNGKVRGSERDSA